MKLHKIIIFCLSLLFISCNGQSKKEFQSIKPEAFSQKIKATSQPQIIDVRSPKEFSDQHLDGAVNINWNGDDFDKKVADLDKSKPVFVYCLSGGRSSKASSKLAEMGFEVYEMDGGIVKWNASGLAQKTDKTSGMSLAEYEKLLVSDKKVLINFYADWCAPCVKMKPFITKMEKELKDVAIIRVDADANKSLLIELKIEELPTLLLYENKEVKWKHSGFISEEDLTKKL